MLYDNLNTASIQCICWNQPIKSHLTLSILKEPFLSASPHPNFFIGAKHVKYSFLWQLVQTWLLCIKSISDDRYFVLHR
jgi:hypothetical protein